ncbi:MAG TPA: extracellular solute-binding protein, partial [Chloroflexota bacterium]|nr:extracellular solute-binding protein [Chloroflexota bacterium]
MTPHSRGWRGWLHRGIALVLVMGMLLPAFSGSSLAATYDPTAADGTSVDKQTGPATSRDKSFEELTAEDLFSQPIYEFVKADWDKTFKPTTGVSVEVPAVNYVGNGGVEDLRKVDNFQGKPGQTLVWANDDGWVEWELDIPQTGLYQITMEYFPVSQAVCAGCNGKRASVQRDLYIDGQLPFREAKRIVFQRVWKEASWPPKRDNKGQDIRPAQIEAPQWETKTLEDADGRYEVPFQFAFTQGKHKIRMETVREPIALRTITVHSPIVIPTYQQRLAEWKAKGAKETSGKGVRIEAEEMYLKSDPTIRGEVSFDALASPGSEGLFRLNSFGHWRWRLPGQWARWKINVPEDGLYYISMSDWQGWSGRRPRIRQLRIDGEVPFQEMQTILFRSDKDWRLDTMRREQLTSGEPFLFYFTRGEHILQMDVVIGFMSQTVRAIDQSLTEMSTLSRQMLMVTGSQPDPNMEWDLHEKIPGLLDRLQEIADRLDKEAVRMEEIGRSKNDASSAFRVVTDQIRTMIKRPHDIHRLIEDFNRSQGILASWLLNLQNHPLQIDWIMVHSPDVVPPRVHPNFFEQTWASIKTFLGSFTRDYTGLGSSYAKGAQKTIEVWVGRGTEWGQIMKDMIEDDFTPNTGIKVNLRVIPPASLGEGAGSVLLLATTAGEAPDVAVGVPSQLPVDFAVRGGLVNLSDFPDYKQVADRFRPGALVPFRYTLPGKTAEGNWAIPETQDFAMTFYRTDILFELGLKPPDTWDDVYDALLKLQQNGLDFYYPPPTGVAVTEGAVGFTPFLF